MHKHCLPNELLTLCKFLHKCWANFHSFAHNFLISRLFSTRKLLNRSSRFALSHGQRVVNQILLLVWLRPWSNLVNPGQLWSNLVNIVQTFPNLEKCALSCVLRVLKCNWPLLESTRLGSGCLVLRADTRENPGVKIGL